MYILLVDDDTNSRQWIGMFLRQLGHQVIEAGNGEEALSLYQSKDFGMVLSDIKMPGLDGIELLQTITSLSESPGADIVLFTGHGDMETAITALRSGAYDYLLKPINMEELAALTGRIAEHQSLVQENKRLTINFDSEVRTATAETQRELSELKNLVAQSVGLGQIGIFSDATRKVVEQAYKYHTDRTIPVLIQGETGTGKEIVAKLIHYGNSICREPFIDINCAAFSSNLFESELFGYEPGAFTGGLAKGQKGKLELANGGTLFLDEVGEMPLDLQSKLLRVFQEKNYYRVGGVKKLSTDIRLICATNVDLSSMVSQGKFRKDLYYRLKVGSMMLTPLRNRPEEILPLARMFLIDFAKTRKKKFTDIAPDAAALLNVYPWPGNTRELRNVMEWVTFMFDEKEVRAEHLTLLAKETTDTARIQSVSAMLINPADFSLPQCKFDLEEFTTHVIHKAMEMHNGNKTKTANYLNMSRRALCYKLEHLETAKAATPKSKKTPTAP